MIPDVRFTEGYENLKKMMDVLLSKFDVKQLQEVSKALHTDLEYYRTMAEYHSPLGLTDDRRRVWRLEKEISKMREVLAQYPFIKLDADGSLILNENVSIDTIEDILNSFDDKKASSPASDQKLDEILNRLDAIENKTSEPSLAKTIIIGLLINFISSLIQPTSPNQTLNTTINITNQVIIVEESTYWVSCNNLDVYQDPNSEQVVKQITGIRKIAVLRVEGDWVLIEVSENGEYSGWIKKDILTRNKLD